MLTAYGLAFLAACLFTALATPFVRRAALHLGVVDRPDHRKVHTGEVPRLGGVALVLGIILTIAAICAILPGARALLNAHLRQLTWLLAGAAVVCLAGVLDDVRGLEPMRKLQLQVIAALLAYWGGSQFRLFEGGGEGFPFGSLVNLAASVFWIAAITNSINLIDGLDGLAAGITTIVVLALGIISHAAGFSAAALLAMVVAGSCVGFLPFNFYPARIFLGDSGSFLLGYLLAALSMQLLEQKTPVSSVPVLLVLFSVPLMDLALAIVRRALKGQNLFVADGNHIHHRLLRRGLGHARSVAILWATTLLFGGLALLLSFVVSAQDRLVLHIVAVLLLAIAVLRFGASEIRQGRDSLRFVRERRRQSPRRRTLMVRRAARRLASAPDVEAVGGILEGLARDIDLDLLDIEVTLDGPGPDGRLPLVRFARSAPPAPTADQALEAAALGTTSARLGGPGGLRGTVVLGRESWKLRRLSEEDRIWASLLAQGILSLEDSLLPVLTRRRETAGREEPLEPVLEAVGGAKRFAPGERP